MKPSLPVTSRPLFGRLAPSGVTGPSCLDQLPPLRPRATGCRVRGRRVGKPQAGAVAPTPVVLTDEDLERLPYGGPHKGM